MPPQHDSLTLELWGMVSERQLEEKTLGDDIEQQAAIEEEAEVLPEPEPDVVQEEEPEKVEEIPEPEPDTVQVEKPVEEKPAEPPAEKPRPRPRPQPVRVASPQEPRVVESAAAIDSTKGEQEEQAQQTTAEEIEATIMRRYLVGLRKAIEANLIYPSSGRKEGAIGVPVIRFTITEAGHVLPGSLTVYKSSGFAVLDEAAKKAALESVPLPLPPRQIEVTIAISFKEKI